MVAFMAVALLGERNSMSYVLVLSRPSTVAAGAVNPLSYGAGARSSGG
jgi:hypothetical protein